MPGTNVEEIPEVEAIASYESLKELLDGLGPTACGPCGSRPTRRRAGACGPRHRLTDQQPSSILQQLPNSQHDPSYESVLIWVCGAAWELLERMA
jgi:hypothetical protein